MARKYHTLLSRDNADSPWRIEFGDFDRETVEQERAEYRDNGAKASTLKIITTGAAQKDIESVVATLNAKQGVPQ